MGQQKDSKQEDELKWADNVSAVDKLAAMDDPGETQKDVVGNGDQSNSTLSTESEGFRQAGKILSPGQMFANNYKIVSVLGIGGNSVVYKAHHMLLNRDFAIKVLLPDRIPKEKAIRRFQQEAQAVSHLEHPNIVKLNEFGLDEAGQPYLVMSYVEGIPLSQLIEQTGRLNVDRSIKLVSAAADALKHAHAEGIIHRDIKPSNIIITTGINGTESVKIVDFGIAKIEIEGEARVTLTETGEVFGSPAYMSPEQCLGQPTDARTDIYSLGCVLYECVMGKPPFDKRSALETLMSHIQQPVTFDPLIAIGELKTVIENCLAKRVRLRYQSIAELQSDLQRIQTGMSPQRKAAGLSQRKLLNIAWLAAAALSIPAIIYCASKFQQANQTPPATPTVTVPSSGYYGGASPSDFAPGAIKPHIANPLGTASGDAYAEADSMDKSSLVYFQKGDYKHAIQMLEFCRDTYHEGGTHFDPQGNIETAYRAEDFQHLGQCYVAMHQLDQAAANYKEALRLYTKVTLKSIPLYDQAVFGYVAVLQQQGKNAEADSVTHQYQTIGKVTNVP